MTPAPSPANTRGSVEEDRPGDRQRGRRLVQVDLELHHPLAVPPAGTIEDATSANKINAVVRIREVLIFESKVAMLRH